MSVRIEKKNERARERRVIEEESGHRIGTGRRASGSATCNSPKKFAIRRAGFAVAALQRRQVLADGLRVPLQPGGVQAHRLEALLHSALRAGTVVFLKRRPKKKKARKIPLQSHVGTESMAEEKKKNEGRWDRSKLKEVATLKKASISCAISSEAKSSVSDLTRRTSRKAPLKRSFSTSQLSCEWPEYKSSPNNEQRT